MPTLDDIQKAVEQIPKNMATKSEVTDLIDEKIKEDKEARQKELAESTDIAKQQQKTIDELKKFNDSIAAELRALKKSNFRQIKTSSGMYNGVWGDLQTAKEFGLFVLSEVGGSKGAGEMLKGLGIEVEKDMGGGTGSAGGALVPQEFIPNLITLIEKYGVFRRNVLEYPMGAPEAVAPKLSSGLTVYCPGEGVSPTKSDPGFTNVGFQAKKWITLTAISRELDEDSAIAVGELVGRLIAQAFAKKEDEVGFLGDGTSTYFGHTGIAGALMAVDGTIGNIKSLVVGSGNAYSELTPADFEKLLGNVPDYADDGVDLKWYCHRYFYYTVMVKLALALGGVNATEVQQNRIGREKQYLGYPVEFTHVMPKAEANSQICTLLANLRMGAYLGDRRKLTVDQSDQVYFASDQIGIRGTERVAPAIYGVGDTTDAGPITGLITAAS